MQIILAFFVIFVKIFLFFRQNTPFSHMRIIIIDTYFLWDTGDFLHFRNSPQTALRVEP